MKKVLITGANSYIGTSFEKYIEEKYPDDFIIDTVDMTDECWKEKTFSGYDCVFHVAGIAHSDSEKISDEKAKLYYKINTELVADTAKKAKNDGVEQFIFMSSAIVYGASAPVGKIKIITEETETAPENCYGDSKVQAEKALSALSDDQFKVAIIRSPTVYGKNSKGNYPLLSRIAVKSPFFPYIENQRSMIYVENLCEFIRLVIKNDEQGFFWPQNREYSNTSELVKMIACAHGKKIIMIKAFSFAIKFFSGFVKSINKAFGNLTYSKELSYYSENYCLYSLEESIGKTEAL